MRWDLEELTEDAFRDYLKGQVNDELSVYAAWEFETPTYPCVVVHAANMDAISETATWHDPRNMAVECAVMTEAAPETDDQGNVILTIRERNAKARSKVLDALCKTGLLALVNAKIKKAALSMAQVSGWTRSVDDNRLVTTIKIDVIAEPVTGTT